MSREARLEWYVENRPVVNVLDGERCTIGKGSADIVLQDRAVSRVHASIERVTGGWVVQDLGSRNGTFVNGVRVVGPRALRSGDEIRFGSAVTTFRAMAVDDTFSQTAPLEPAPGLTPRERDALVALCRPVLENSLLEEPASVTEVAAELTVSTSAAKKLVTRLYDKFDLYDTERRRGRLVVEAIRRGAVSAGDVGN